MPWFRYFHEDTQGGQSHGAVLEVNLSPMAKATFSLFFLIKKMQLARPVQKSSEAHPTLPFVFVLLLDSLADC